MKKLFVFSTIISVLMILSLFIFAGCQKEMAEQEEPLCKSPYLEYKTGECCLDSNSNGICDSDEIIEEDTLTQQVEQPQEIVNSYTKTIHRGQHFRVYPLVIDNINYSVEFNAISEDDGKCRFLVTAGDSLGYVRGESITGTTGILPGEEYDLKRFALKFKLLSCDIKEENAEFELSSHKELLEEDYVAVSINQKDTSSIDEHSCEVDQELIIQKCERLGKKANVMVSVGGREGSLGGVRFYFYDSNKQQVGVDTSREWFYTGKSKVFMVDLIKDSKSIEEIHLLPIDITGYYYTACTNKKIVLNPTTDCSLPE